MKTERTLEYKNFEVLNSDNSDEAVDIVIIPDGYTKDEMDKFKMDCEKFAGFLFNATPFKENKNKFNIWGIEAPSKESGTDIPAENIWKNTIANSQFYMFDLDRYLMTSDNKTLRNLASNAPYDQIFILVNSKKYGGGAIYNHYSVCVSDNPYSEYIFSHELLLLDYTDFKKRLRRFNQLDRLSFSLIPTFYLQPTGLLYHNSRRILRIYFLNS